MKSHHLLLVFSTILFLLALFPISNGSPGHYVHDYYREGTYNGRGGLKEQERSPRHLNHRNTGSAVHIDFGLTLFMSTLMARGASYL